MTDHKTPDEDTGRFNISRWALQHPDLTRYLMIVLMILGLAAYFQLGQDEDPPFTFRAMVVQAYWPGASAKDVSGSESEPKRSASCHVNLRVETLKSPLATGVR